MIVTSIEIHDEPGLFRKLELVNFSCYKEMLTSAERMCYTGCKILKIRQGQELTDSIKQEQAGYSSLLTLNGECLL